MKKLKKIIKQQGYNYTSFFRVLKKEKNLGISFDCYMSKLNGKYAFTVPEIILILQLLDLDLEDIL